MSESTLRFHTLRDPAPQADEPLARYLVQQVREAIPRKQAGPAVVMARGDRAEVIGIRELRGPDLPPTPDAIALMTRASFPDGAAVRAIGLMGVYGYRARPEDPAVPTALVFIEWTDGRWWQWRALIDPSDARLLTETETVLRAVDGLPRPNGLGGWWTRGRRLGGRPVFRKQAPQQTSDVVH